jgi:hypothetical protein
MRRGGENGSARTFIRHFQGIKPIPTGGFVVFIARLMYSSGPYGEDLNFGDARGEQQF